MRTALGEAGRWVQGTGGVRFSLSGRCVSFAVSRRATLVHPVLLCWVLQRGADLQRGVWVGEVWVGRVWGPLLLCGAVLSEVLGCPMGYRASSPSLVGVCLAVPLACHLPLLRDAVGLGLSLRSFFHEAKGTFCCGQSRAVAGPVWGLHWPLLVHPRQYMPMCFPTGAALAWGLVPVRAPVPPRSHGLSRGSCARPDPAPAITCFSKG